MSVLRLMVMEAVEVTAAVVVVAMEVVSLLG